MATTGLTDYYLLEIEHRSGLFHPRCRNIMVCNETSIVARRKSANGSDPAHRENKSSSK
jgi:hypothetical protein